MSLVTPEGLERSVETLARVIQQLVSDVERLKADVAELRTTHNTHSHPVTATTTAASGDSSASVTAQSGTPI